MSDHVTSAAVRAQLSHPVIDADGHIIEFLPVVRDYLVEVGGRKLAEEFESVLAASSLIESLSEDEGRSAGAFKMTWWAYPARNTRDRVTGMLPGLLYERLDEFGLDFAVLYPTLGLMAMSLEQSDLRQAAIRALAEEDLVRAARAMQNLDFLSVERDERIDGKEGALVEGPVEMPMVVVEDHDSAFLQLCRIQETDQ